MDIHLSAPFKQRWSHSQIITKVKIHQATNKDKWNLLRRVKYDRILKWKYLQLSIKKWYYLSCPEDQQKAKPYMNIYEKLIFA